MITVTAERMAHILDGGGKGGSAGHRHGSSDRTKSTFPAAWSDATIEAALLSVANDPASRQSVQPNGKIRIEGLIGGIRIRVVVRPDISAVVTAHPC